MTKLATIVLVALVALVDALLLISGTETISEFLYVTSRDYPVIALAAGIIVGHIFWPVKVGGK